MNLLAYCTSYIVFHTIISFIVWFQKGSSFFISLHFIQMEAFILL
ncbi:hypothetical protein CHCC20335_4395 [Bacillus paralicheniformis]|nr:hypothetical protein CHCC20335_4395 [Bacillus paralicheniformis]